MVWIKADWQQMEMWIEIEKWCCRRFEGLVEKLGRLQEALGEGSITAVSKHRPATGHQCTEQVKDLIGLHNPTRGLQRTTESLLDLLPAC
jgi:hypothetical protein